jgi:signal transduction histidine kinase
LFDVHNQYSTYGTAHEKGSGLGLILCHEFIKKSGGEIVIQSKKDVGTTISFTLPKSGKS